MGKKIKRAANDGAECKPHQPAPPCKEVNKYMRRLREQLLQPGSKRYGGMGYAKDSVFVPLDDPEYDAKFAHIWKEHVPGFSGKSFKKRKSASDDGMLWKQRLHAKQAAIQQPLVQAIASTKSMRGQANSSKHSSTDQAQPRPCSLQNVHHTLQLSKGEKSRKKAAANQEAAQLQSEAIAAYRKLKKARTQD